MSDEPKRILITGGTGFVGSYLVRLLKNNGEKDLHVTTFGGVPESLRETLEGIQVHAVDLTDQKATNQLIETIAPTQVYHLAAFSSVADSLGNVKKTLENNISLQVSVLEAIREKAPEARVLVVGSAEEYGLSEPGEIPISEDHPLRPANPYAVSKVTQDLLAYSYQVSYGLSILRVRPFNHTGAGQVPHFAIPSFAQQIVAIERGAEPTLRVGNLEAIRDISHVADVVEAYVKIMEKGTIGEVYNVGTGQGTRMKDVVDALVAASTKEISVIVDTDRLRPLDIPEMIANNEKIRSLGWEPTHTMIEIVNEVLEWYRTQEDA